MRLQNSNYKHQSFTAIPNVYGSIPKQDVVVLEHVIRAIGKDTDLIEINVGAYSVFRSKTKIDSPSMHKYCVAFSSTVDGISKSTNWLIQSPSHIPLISPKKLLLQKLDKFKQLSNPEFVKVAKENVNRLRRQLYAMKNDPKTTAARINKVEFDYQSAKNILAF